MTLAIHNLKPARGAKRPAKRVGRGNASGHGTYSTRGGKGQTARSGGSHRLRLKAFKRLMQSTPKLPGFKSLRRRPAEITTGQLEKVFSAGETVSLASLKEKGLAGREARAARLIFNGELKKKLTLDGLLISAGAAEAVKKAGGEIKSVEKAEKE